MIQHLKGEAIVSQSFMRKRERESIQALQTCNTTPTPTVINHHHLIKRHTGQINMRTYCREGAVTIPINPHVGFWLKSLQVPPLCQLPLVIHSVNLYWKVTVQSLLDADINEQCLTVHRSVTKDVTYYDVISDLLWCDQWPTVMWSVTYYDMISKLLRYDQWYNNISYLKIK